VLADANVQQRLTHVPHVPLQQAQQPVAAGVHISYAQLLEAASSMVAGVEVWVQARHQAASFNLFVIPVEVFAICCCSAVSWVSCAQLFVADFVTLLRMCMMLSYSR
jgi:heme/copper-type cytochrome/quinol oxidase subunit 1